MSRVVGVTVDCVDIDRVAEFWGGALGIPTVAQQSPRSRVLGVAVGEQQLRLTFRRVASAKVAANRLRLAVRTAELDSETAACSASERSGSPAAATLSAGRC